MTMLINPHRFAAAGGGGGSLDLWFANVVLLSGFDGADGSTSLTDESSFARALTAGGNAQLDTAQFKFGSSALLLDGTGDYVSAADSEDWNFGASNFTIELWVRFPVAPTTVTFAGQGTSGNWQFYYETNQLKFVGAGTLTDTSASAFSTGIWHHIVLERSGSTIRLYRNGAMTGKGTSTATIANVAAALILGIFPNLSSNPLNGHIDECRITYGIARYDSDAGYTVPTAAFPRAADTSGYGDYRYYKFVLSGPNDGSNVALFTEISVAESNGGADVGRQARVSGSAGKFSSAEGPDKAINDNTGDWWQPDIATSAEIIFDFFTPRTLAEAIFTPHPSFLGRTPNSILVYGSHDNSTYTLLDSNTGMTTWSGARTFQW